MNGLSSASILNQESFTDFRGHGTGLLSIGELSIVDNALLIRDSHAVVVTIDLASSDTSTFSQRFAVICAYTKFEIEEVTMIHELNWKDKENRKQISSCAMPHFLGKA